MAPPLPPGIGPGRLVRARWGLWVLAAVTLLAWAPVLSVVFTYAVAGALGCQVDESSVHPCPGPFGWNLGGLLAVTGVMGWMMLVTAPVMLLTALAWTVLGLRRVLRRWWR